MDSHTPPPQFFETFNSIQEDLVRAIQRAYDNATEGLSRDYGSDEQHMGFTLYKYILHELRQLQQETGVVAVVSKGQAFHLEVGDYQLNWARVGYSARDNIWESFPKNENVSPKTPDLQISFNAPGFDNAAWDAKAIQRHSLILAHRGSLDEGCEAVDICFPAARDADSGLISRWAYCHSIWATDNIISAADLALEGLDSHIDSAEGYEEAVEDRELDELARKSSAKRKDGDDDR